MKPDHVPSSYSCIWLTEKLDEALNTYQDVFPGFEVQEKSSIAATFTIMGTKMMLLMGGPKYQPNKAVSYFVYTDGEDHAESLYRQLSEGGRIIFPLQSYPWAKYYAWVEDKFGVNWQIDADPIRSAQKIVPCLLFTQAKRFKIREAIEWYTSVFPESRMLMEAPQPPQEGIPEDTILFAQMKSGHSIYNLMSSMDESHDFEFTPGNSFVIPCISQEEIDYYWDALGKDGEYQMCGWLRDRYGVSWQVVPEVLPRLMADPAKAKAVTEAFLQMQKFDLNHLLSL